MSIASPEIEHQVVPRTASASWRTWLMTGTRKEPIARRRVRGANKGLKRMLVEGMADAGEGPRTWKSFSGSMVRQAVEEAVSSLPPRQKQLIKLAYFSNLTNREIAQGLGITLSSVERGLRQGVAQVSEQVERGRTAGRRAIYALAMFLGGRWLSDAHEAITPNARQWVQASALVIVGAAAGAFIAVQPASPAQLNHAEAGSPPVVLSEQPQPVVPQRVVEVPQSSTEVLQPVVPQTAAAGPVQVASPAAAVVAAVAAVPAVPLPIPVKVPPIVPAPPLPHGLLGA